MTLLQTKVDDKTAKQFERIAHERGETPYSLLQKLVKDTAAQSEPRTWEKHFEWLAGQPQKPLPFNTVVKNREESGER